MPAETVPSARPIGLPPIPLSALAARVGVPVSTRAAADVTAVGVTGITLRSTDVRPGDVFAALPGSVTHGAAHAGDAARAGAVAVLTDAKGHAQLLQQPDAADLPVLIAEQPRAVVGPLAAEIYHHPSRKLSVIGVTGTSGKTTTCYLIEAALAATGQRTGLIGTVAVRIDGQALPSALTTPEAPDLHALFAVMAQRGVTTVAMEVSSHALALGRVDGVAFAVGAFTNLSQDHLDFHGDMESYFEAKRRLFDGRAAAEVVVIDDEYGRRLAAERPRATTVSTRPATPADWTVTEVVGVRGDPGIQRCTVSGPNGLVLRTDIALPGAFNIANAATALACVAAVGGDAAAGARGLTRVTVPGRMERVDRGQPFLALVDYAHKPAALRAVLEAVRDHCAGRVIVVIGAGGDRDHGKRPLMGAAAARGADLVIVTDDNPRSEDPAAIRAAVLAGAVGAFDAASAGEVARAEVREVGDRRRAIADAVAAARAGDVVLIAGKGHEQGQEIAGRVHPFSDRDELAAALDARYSATGVRP